MKRWESEGDEEYNMRQFQDFVEHIEYQLSDEEIGFKEADCRDETLDNFIIRGCYQ